VRQTTTQGFLTIKGISVGAVRAEYEYEIPYQEAAELLDQFATAEISKIRYKLQVDGKLWEIDEFLGDNSGLMVAEIELNSEDEHFALPDWVDVEVTGDEKYYNSSLTTNPYKRWNN
jgi:CYTH domain-containing protein